MAKMLSPALCILLLAIVFLNFASTSMPRPTLSDHYLPLSRFQLATPSQPFMVSRNSSGELPTKPSSLPLAESQQLASESDKEKEEEEKEEKQEEKERKKEEKEREKEEKKEKKKKKKKKDCSLATTIVKQPNMGVLFMVSLAFFFFFFF